MYTDEARATPPNTVIQTVLQKLLTPYITSLIPTSTSEEVSGLYKEMKLGEKKERYQQFTFLDSQDKTKHHGGMLCWHAFLILYLVKLYIQFTVWVHKCQLVLCLFIVL